MHAEIKSYGIGGRYIALVVGGFGEFPKDFAKLRGNSARQRARAYNEHFSSLANSSVNRAMSMFKPNITSRWALMAARGWAWLILDRRRDLISDRPYRATNPSTHTHGAYQHAEAA